MKPQFGASFSLKYAREMGVDPQACLEAGLKDLGLRRLRLMSYWDIHESYQDRYDFTELDWQIELAEKYGAEVTLCLGLRQPRWPESHWPEWALKLPSAAWHTALDAYITEVVTRYKNKKCVVSWQLENEARLKKFGLKGDFDRARLKREYGLVKSLDPAKPVIMTMSDSWGIPFFGPKPDLYGLSLYRYFFDRGAYRHSSRPPLFYRLRAVCVRIFKLRRTFIHELQAEPWGPKGTSELTLEEQFKSIDETRVKEAVAFARATGLYPIDLWGLEWWYWLKTAHTMPEIWDYIKSVING